MQDSVYVFAARLVDHDGHLYSFWLSGVHWDGA